MGQRILNQSSGPNPSGGTTMFKNQSGSSGPCLFEFCALLWLLSPQSLGWTVLSAPHPDKNLFLTANQIFPCCNFDSLCASKFGGGLYNSPFIQEKMAISSLLLVHSPLYQSSLRLHTPSSGTIVPNMSGLGKGYRCYISELLQSLWHYSPQHPSL